MMTHRKKSRLDASALRITVWAAAIFTAGVLVSVMIYVLVRGVPALSADMFSLEYTSENVSLMPAMINTLTTTALTLLAAVPLGIGAAVYLTEYARCKKRCVSIIRTAVQTLSGIPSVVYGLFGYLLFVSSLRWGYCLSAGALTLAIMILPVIIQTSEEALLSVPDAYREGSFGLGAGRVRTVFKVVLPAARPGITAGIVLSVGRITAETASLIYTAGSVAQVPETIFGSGRTLAVHIYALWAEGLNTDAAYATAVILLVIAAALNALSSRAAMGAGKKPPNGRMYE